MSTWTAQTKNTINPTSQSKGLTAGMIEQNGLFYGFGAFTYSGGQMLAPGSLPVWTAQTKNNAVITNQTKN